MKSEYKKIAKRCDEKWSEIIKIRANFKSEISGKTKEQGYVLAAHHISGKQNATLRWLTFENGICLENMHEHFWGCHSGSQGLKEKIRKEICRVRGNDIFERMQIIKHNKTSKANIRLIEIYLDHELKRLKILNANG